MNSMSRLRKGLIAVAAILALGTQATPVFAQTWTDLRGNTYEIRNARATTKVTRIAPGMYAEGGPGGTLTVSKTVAVQHTLSGSVAVSNRVLTATFAFDVTQSVSLNYSYSKSIPAGRRMGVQFYNIFQAYEYDVWMKPLLGKRAEKIGSGVVLRPYGTSFVATLK